MAAQLTLIDSQDAKQWVTPLLLWQIEPRIPILSKWCRTRNCNQTQQVSKLNEKIQLD